MAQAGRRGSRNWLRLRFDNARREGEAVPLLLGTTLGRPVPVTVSSTTGRTALATSREAAVRASSASVRLPGYGRGVVWVVPRKSGPPLEPGDVLTVRTPDGVTQIEAWIEPVGGEWRPGDFRDGRDRPTRDLGIVAIHAALMRKAGDSEIVMWSMPRLRGPDGKPLADPDRPGQWQWYKFKLNDVESRVLDVRTRRTHDRPLPEVSDGPDGAAHTGHMPRRDNIFCSGSAHLPDGRLLVAGGHEVPEYARDDNAGHTHNANPVYLYDPRTPAGWEKSPLKLDPIRWYPTVTALPDGRMLITSGTRKVLEGNQGDFTGAQYWDSINNDYVIYDPGTRSMVRTGETELIDESKLGRTPNGKPEKLATYPGVFVLPKPGSTGAVVAMAETNRAWLYSYEPDDGTQPLKRADAVYRMRTAGSRSYPTYGSMVLLPLEPDEHRARILAVGGQHEDNGNHRDLRAGKPATDTAEILEVDTGDPLTRQRGWRDPEGSPRMGHARVLCDSTLLADGTVLVSGGAKSGWGDQNYGPVHEAELFDPGTETFSPAARASTDRRYHSTALLQLDGTLLKMGSTGGFGNVNATDTREQYRTELDENGKPWMTVHTDAERYYPPYLYRGPRPAIESIDGEGGGAVLRYGENVEIAASGVTLDIRSRVAIIRFGATTHGNDMDQRYVWLRVRSRAPGEHGWTITARLPGNPAAAPPGDYQLVVVDGFGVPSPGEVVRMRA